MEHVAEPGTARARAVVLLLSLTLALPAMAQERGLALLDSIQSALRGNPAIKIGREVAESALAGRQVESGAFDTAASASLNRDYLAQPLVGFLTVLAKADQQRVTTMGGDLRVDRLFRTGFTLSPVLTVRRSYDNLFNLTSPTAASANLVFSMPLMRGRGTSVTTAAERAADVEYQASLLDARQAASDVVLTTVQAYWTYASAVEISHILGTSEAAAERLLAQTRILVAAQTVPAADLNQLLATHADRTAARIGAEQTVVEARQSLGVAMALDAPAIATLPEPADNFPSPPPAIAASAAAFIGSALAERADYLAAVRRLQALQIRRERAGDDLKPRVDVTASAGYAGLAEGDGPTGFFTSFGDRLAGPNFGFGLRYSGVVDNTAARGRLASADAQYRLAGVQRDDLERRIGAEVSVALSRVRTSAAALEQSDRALDAFRTALVNEEMKLRLGISTLMDVVTLEDRLTVASQRKATGQMNLAIAIAQLHHAIGDLVPPGNTVTLSTMMTMPPDPR